MIKRLMITAALLFAAQSQAASLCEGNPDPNCKGSPDRAEDYVDNLKRQAAAPDEDGSRWLHRTFLQQGMGYAYVPAQNLKDNKAFMVVDIPQSGDVGWWPNMVALYSQTGITGAYYYFRGHKYAAHFIEQGRGKPVWLRYKNRKGDAPQ